MAQNLLLTASQKPQNYYQWFLFSCQHVFAMFGANILAPLVINNISGQMIITTSMALFASGLGTLIYILVTKAKVPIYLGSSFAYMTTIGTLLKITDRTSNGSVFLALFFVGLGYMLVALIIYFIGNKWINKILPPVVIGPMIIIIGLSVAGIAINNSGLNPPNWVSEKEVYPYWIAILIAGITLLAIISFNILCKGIFKVIPILLGMILGYLVALIFHFSSSYEIINTSLLTNINNWSWHPWNKSVFKGIWNIDNKILVTAIFSLLPLIFITIAEHIGDHINIGQITGNNYLKNPGLHRTLLGDGLATSVSAIIGGPPNTTYSENASVVSITRMGSVWVTGGAAVIAIGVSFLAPVTQIITMVPKPIMGGVGIVLFGLIATNGIKVLFDNQVNLNDMKNVFVIGIMLILAIGKAVLNIAGGLRLTGMSLASIVGIILNLLLHSNLWIKLKILLNKE